MKKYMLIDDLSCRYLADTKKDMIEYIKMCKKDKHNFLYDDKIKDLEIRFIKYDGRKIEVDDFFGDIIAIDKQNKENGAIEYDDYSKYGITDGIAKKDFLYHNL